MLCLGNNVFLSREENVLSEVALCWTLLIEEIDVVFVLSLKFYPFCMSRINKVIINRMRFLMYETQKNKDKLDNCLWFLLVP